MKHPKIMVIAAASVLMMGTGCRAKKSSVRALKSAGYTDIELHGYPWLCCGGYWFGDTFTAKGPTGEPVSGCVCKGIVQGSTIKIK
jgi:hypothetical protein